MLLLVIDTQINLSSVLSIRLYFITIDCIYGALRDTNMRSD